MRTLLLAAATLGTTACLGATDPVRARAADVGVTISASRAPALDADAQQTAVTPAFVDIAITAPVGGATAELLRTSVVPDSAGRRVPLRVELGACLGEKDTCALTITVRLRAANGAPYDSSTVGPIAVSPGASLELPVIRFRPTARLALLDSTLRVTLGGSTTVRVNALDAASQLLLGRALVWRSLDPAIATVDGSGRVTALGQGRARIEAAREGLTVTAVVQATAVEQLQLRASVTRARVGDRVTLTPTISVVGGRSARVTYSSSNPAVAVVDSTGQVTAVGPGAVQLSASAVADTSQRAQVTLTVDPVRAAVSARFVSTGSRGTLPGNVLDLEAVAADSVFAVGCGDTGSGFLARFDGSDWRNIEAPGLLCPRAVAHLSDGTLLVLNHSRLLRYRNSTWSSEALPVTASVSSLATVGTTIFVGGANGTVLRWNGSWTTYTLGSGADVTQLSAAEDGAVYAATGGQTPQLHRFSNGAWQPVDAGVPWAFITAVQVYSATEVFVGGATASGFTTVRFSGSGWSAPTSTAAVPSFFRAFAAAGSTRYGLTAQGEVYRWTGTTWALEQSTGLQEAHLVGGATWLVAAGWHGSSWRQSQGSWRRLTHVPALTALWASSPTFMLAGGHEGAIEQFDGTAWRSVKAPGARHVRAIFGADSTDARASSQDASAANGTHPALRRHRMATRGAARQRTAGADRRDVA